MNDARQICVAFSAACSRVARYVSDVSVPAHVGGHKPSEPLPVLNSSESKPHTRSRYNHKLLVQLSLVSPGIPL